MSARASLFATCLNDTLFPSTAIATTLLLERLGYEVDFPRDQTCCGQMHLNTGYRTAALRLARRFVRAFAASELVVVPSASCAATVRELYPQLAAESGDPAFARSAGEVAARVRELSEVIVGRIEDLDASFPTRVAYHPTCHSLRLLRVEGAPLRLLRAVRGLELVPLADAHECCGFGGTFAVKNEAVSAAIAADKADAVVASGAEVLTALDNSCLMNIGGVLTRRGASVRTLHLAEILAS